MCHLPKPHMLKKVSSSFLACTPCVKRMYSEGCQARQILEPNWFLPYVCVERCNVISGYKWHLPAYWICWCVSLNLLLRMATIAYALTSSPFTVNNTQCSWSRSMDVDGTLRANMAEASSIEDKFHSPNRGWSMSGHNIGPPPKPNLSCTLFQPCPGGWNSHTLHQPTTRVQCWYRPSAPADRFQWSVGRCRCGKNRPQESCCCSPWSSAIHQSSKWHDGPTGILKLSAARWHDVWRNGNVHANEPATKISYRLPQRSDWTFNSHSETWYLAETWWIPAAYSTSDSGMFEYGWTTIASGICVWSWKSCSTSWSQSARIHIWSKTYRSWIHALSVIHTKKARWQGHLLLDPVIIGCVPQFSQGG